MYDAYFMNFIIYGFSLLFSASLFLHSARGPRGVLSVD